MNGRQARLLLDGADAFLEHIPMPIKQLNKVENAYHVLRNTINQYYGQEVETSFEKYEHPEEWNAYRVAGEDK